MKVADRIRGARGAGVRQLAARPHPIAGDGDVVERGESHGRAPPTPPIAAVASA